MLRGIAGWVVEREQWWLLLAVPAFLLPEFLSPLLPVSALTLATLVTCRIVTRHSRRAGGMIDPGLALVLVMLPVSLWITSDYQRSFPKFTTTLIGIALFYSLSTGLERRHVRPASILLALSGLGLAAISLVTTDWPRTKILPLSVIYDNLPRLMMTIPRSTRGRIDANEVAGALVMLIPFVLAVLAAAWQQCRGEAAAVEPSGGKMLPAKALSPRGTSRTSRWPLLLSLFITLALLLALFVLTQSRGALAALAVGLLLFAVLRWRWLVLAWLVGGVAVLFWGIVSGHVAALQTAMQGASSWQDIAVAWLGALHAATRVGSDSMAGAVGRVEMWSNALQAIADYPLTGIGLNTFPAVSWANYGYTAVSPTWNMTHCHNAYLQAGVDVGILGLLGLLLFLGALLWRGWCVVKSKPPAFVSWLTYGILAGIVGHLVHSLVDAVARPLGDKPGIIFWALAGLLVAIERLYVGRGVPVRSVRRTRTARVAGLVVAGMVLVLAAGPGPSVVRLNAGAVALDRARLVSGLSKDGRAALLARARSDLEAALPWRADTVYVRLGMAAHEQGDAQAARAYWRQTSQGLPYLLKQVDAALVLGQVQRAGEYADHAVAVAPTSSSALYRAALVALREGRENEARSLLQSALDYGTYSQRQDERADTYSRLAGMSAAQGKWAEAVTLYQQAESVDENFAYQRDLAMAMYRRDGNAVAAEAYVRQAIAQKPKLVGPYLGLMSIYWEEKRCADVAVIGEEAARKFPEATEVWLLLARAYMEQQTYDRAESALRKVVVLRPRLVEGWLLLARVEMERQQPAAALALLDEALGLMPNQAALHVAVGDAQRVLGNVAAAERAYRRALELAPNNAAARRALEELKR